MLGAGAAALHRWSTARPLVSAATTGFVCMSVGDAGSQIFVEGAPSRVDPQRNLVSAAYNGLASPAFYRWYRVMDRMMPGRTPARLLPKVVLSQLVTTGLNNPCYLAWCHHVQALLGELPPDWAAARAATAAQLQRELPHLYGTSMLLWLPVTAANYALVPDHLRVLWVSSCSVLWGGFVSHVAHRQERHAAGAGADRAPRPSGVLPPRPRVALDHPAVACTDHDKISS
jgi:protein Mpv17